MSGEISYPDTSSNPDVSRAVNFLILRDLPRIRTYSLPEPVHEIFFFAQSFVIGNDHRTNYSARQNYNSTTRERR